MSIVQNIFNTLGKWYGEIFSEWLYINFAIRTLILLLCVWAIIIFAAELFKYVVGPLLVLFYYHVIFRAWNFLITETFQEWIYINFYYREKKFLSRTYLKLCDKIRDNRLRLDYTRYKGILLNGNVAKFTNRLMVVAIITGTLWVAAFGLYFEYAYEPEETKISDEKANPTNEPTPEPSPEPESPNASPEPPPIFTQIPSGRESIDSADLFWLDSELLYINEYGADGANIRDMPDGTNSTVVEVVSGGDVLEYLGNYYEDANTPGMFWLKIKTPTGTEGYVSSRLVQ